MKYTAPSFTVPTGHRPSESCSHGWLDVRGRCVFCGAESGFLAILPSPTSHYPATRNDIPSGLHDCATARRVWDDERDTP